MTDKKGQRDSTSAPVHPWYKERLRTKYLKHPVQKQQLAGALDGRRWRFLKPGLDDFRDGYPKLEDVTLTQPKHGTEPTIFGSSSQSHPVRLSKSRFTKEQVCFSKQNCLRQMRRQHVDGVEQSLSAHPLALYPHLASGMLPELFDDVLSVLDPAMCSRIKTPVTCLAQQAESRIENVACEGPIQESTEEKTEPSTSAVPTKERVKGSATRNPYKWREAKKTKADPMGSDRHLSSLSEDEDVKRISKLFCNWVATLGSETNSMTESTIVSLFFSGYEKKPPLKVPAQVTRTEELTDVPRSSVECLSNDNSCRVKLMDLELNKTYTSSVKAKYGAWYLDPKSWKKRPANEPLRDPSVTEDLEQQHTEKDEELKAIHGTQAFKQFIFSNKLRMPQFLSSLFSEEEEQEDKNRDTGRTNSLKEEKDRC